MTFIAGALATALLFVSWVVCFFAGAIAILAAQERDADAEPADSDE